MRLLSIAFDLSLDSVEQIVLAQEELEERLEPTGAELVWNDPAHIRVPLKIMRQVDPAMDERIHETVATVANALVPFKVTAVGLRAFPSAEAPRLLYAAVDDGLDLITGLQKVLNIHLGRIGVAADPRDYRGWALSGRFRTEEGLVDIRPHLDELGDLQFGHSYITHIVLFEGNLGRYGVRWSVNRRFRLGGPRERKGG